MNNININNTTYINNSYSDQPYKKEKVIDNSMSVSKQKSRHTFKKDVEYQRYMFKVILLGNIAVGKTCLLSYFLNKVFKPEYTCTVGIDFKVKTVFLENNKSADLQIWDTSGEERFKTVTRQYYRDASGIVLVYDVTNEKSFADVVHWIDDIKISSKINISIVLVGNKTDLEDKRVVSFKTASNYASQNNIKYIETSAKSGFNVSDLFEDLSQIMINVSDIEEANKKEQNISFAMYKDEVSLKRKEINVKKKNCC